MKQKLNTCINKSWYFIKRAYTIQKIINKNNNKKNIKGVQYLIKIIVAIVIINNINGN
jgi:hypothetical protein